MNDVPELLLDHHLKTLKLPTFLSQYAKLARQCAAENVEHIGYLKRLTELELPGGHRPPKSDLRAPARAGTAHDRTADQGGKVPGNEEPPLSDAMHRLPGNGTASTLSRSRLSISLWSWSWRGRNILSGGKTLSLLGRPVRARRILLRVSACHSR